MARLRERTTMATVEAAARSALALAALLALCTLPLHATTADTTPGAGEACGPRDVLFVLQRGQADAEAFGALGRFASSLIAALDPARDRAALILSRERGHAELMFGWGLPLNTSRQLVQTIVFPGGAKEEAGTNLGPSLALANQVFAHSSTVLLAEQGLGEGGEGGGVRIAMAVVLTSAAARSPPSADPAAGDAAAEAQALRAQGVRVVAVGMGREVHDAGLFLGVAGARGNVFFSVPDAPLPPLPLLEGCGDDGAVDSDGGSGASEGEAVVVGNVLGSPDVGCVVQCSDAFRPVCSEGITFANECHARCSGYGGAHRLRNLPCTDLPSPGSEEGEGGGVSGGGGPDGVEREASTFAPTPRDDLQPPPPSVEVPEAVLSFDLDMNTGLLVLFTAEPHSTRDLSAESIVLQDTRDLGAATLVHLDRSRIAFPTNLRTFTSRLHLQLDASDLARLKAYRIGRDHSSVFLQVPRWPFLAPYAGGTVSVTRLVADADPPHVVHFNFTHMGMGMAILAVHFSEPVDPAGLAEDRFHIRADHSGGGVATAVVVSPRPGTARVDHGAAAVFITLGKAELEALAAAGLATGAATTFLSVEAGAVADFAGNPVEAVPAARPLQAATFTAADGAETTGETGRTHTRTASTGGGGGGLVGGGGPDGLGAGSALFHLVQFELDVNGGFLTLVFSAAVDAGTLRPHRIVMRGGTGVGPPQYALTGARLLSHRREEVAPQRELVLELSDHDLYQVKATAGLADGPRTAFLALGDEAIRSARGASLPGLPVGSAYQATVFIADQGRPSLIEFSLDLARRTLDLTFSEPMDAGSLTPANQLALQNGGPEVLSRVYIVGGGPNAVTVLQPHELRLALADADVARLTSAAGLRDHVYLVHTQFLARDTAGNYLLPTTEAEPLAQSRRFQVGGGGGAGAGGIDGGLVPGAGADHGRSKGIRNSRPLLAILIGAAGAICLLAVVLAVVRHRSVIRGRARRLSTLTQQLGGQLVKRNIPLEWDGTHDCGEQRDGDARPGEGGASEEGSGSTCDGADAGVAEEADGRGSGAASRQAPPRQAPCDGRATPPQSAATASSFGGGLCDDGSDAGFWGGWEALRDFAGAGGGSGRDEDAVVCDGDAVAPRAPRLAATRSEAILLGLDDCGGQGAATCI